MKRRKAPAGRASEFLLGELLGGCPDFDGHMIELMRSASHTRDFQRLFAALGTAESDDIDEIAADLENDSLRILILNFAASQLRESLKLFSKVIAVPAFSTLESSLSPRARSRIEGLKVCVREYEMEIGVLYSILKPLRDKTFHYDPRAAKDWARARMVSESEPKPPVSSVDLERLIFGPGIEFDADLYSRHLFWSDGAQEGLLKAQAEVWQLQETFLQIVADLTRELMKKAGVPIQREFGWMLSHRYGFKKPE